MLAEVLELALGSVAAIGLIVGFSFIVKWSIPIFKDSILGSGEQDE